MRKVIPFLTLLLLLSLLQAPVYSGQGQNPNLDSDGDGLSDGFELSHGTNPKLPDSDFDGLTDGMELKLGTNPVNPDTDGDKLEDGEEISLGTNPLNPDTDSDGLWDGAEAKGDLLFIYVPGKNKKPLPSDPTNPDTDGDGLDDLFEMWLSHYRRITDPSRAFYLHSDWDGDGIIDGDEIYPCPICKPFSASGCPKQTPMAYVQARIGFFKADSDSDGIDDKKELELGTDPFNADTDGDYLLDSWELKLGTSPLSKDTDGDGLTDFKEISPELAEDYINGVIPEWMNLDVGKDTYIGGWGFYGEVVNWTLRKAFDAIADCKVYEYLLVYYPSSVVEGRTFEYLGKECFIPPTTDPTRADTDGDGLTDYEELYFDYIYYSSYGRTEGIVVLNPVKADTDGDGIIDPEDVVPVVPNTEKVHVAEVFRKTGFYSKGDLDKDGLIEPNSCAYYTDCDGDGLPDYYEVVYYNTSITNPDTDGDGLTDHEEIRISTNPLKKDTDGDGFDDFEEVKAGTDPTISWSHPENPPEVEKPTYSKPKELKEPPRPKYNYSIEFYLNGRRIRPEKLITIYTENDEVEFEIKATPIRVAYPNGSVQTFELKTLSVQSDGENVLKKAGPSTYSISLPNITRIGFDFVSIRVFLDYGIRQKGYEFNIEFRYKAQPEVKLVNATWLENLDVGKIVLECHYCKNVTIIVPGALVNGKPKRVISFSETMPLKFIYARIIPHRYTLPGENDVGVIYTKYEDQIEVLKTGKDIGVLTAKMVEAKNIGAKIVYGVVATAKGIKTIVGGVEVFIPEEEETKEAGAGMVKDNPTSTTFDKEAFKKGLLSWVKEKIIDSTFEYVTEKAVEYANAAELEARRHETTYKITVKSCNEFGCRAYSFSVRGYAYDYE